MPYSTCPIPDPLTYNSTTNDYGIPLGRCFVYQHATYGEMVLRFVKFLDAVTYENGHMCVLADATGLWYVTNDISGGTAVGTASSATVPQLAVGCVINSAATVPVQNSFGFVMREGTYLVKSDDSIAAFEHVVADGVDGGLDTMADGEEEQVIGWALADDNNTTHRVLVKLNCP